MTAADHFRRAFSVKNLKELYFSKIKYKPSLGMDRITPKAFESALDENIGLISERVLAGTYCFTRYRQVLISKGRGKEPRVISIPTMRDKLALSAYQRFLRNAFAGVVDESLLHTVIADITEEIRAGCYDGYVKIDITKFYSTIRHDVLLQKVGKKVRKKEAIQFLKNAITTETIPAVGAAPQRSKNTRGVPEGLSISNILADIYLSDFRQRVFDAFSEIQYYRYVDDILILCNLEQAEKIKKFCVDVLRSEFYLKANEQKTKAGPLSEGAAFLGYVFHENTVGIRPAAKEALEYSIENLFRSRKKRQITQKVFLWKLNLKITGCILNGKKYGWLFYYSQLNDLEILFHLDWYVSHLFSRFDLKPPVGLKRFVKTYHEITKNVSSSSYLLNADIYDTAKKRQVLMDIFKSKADIESATAQEIETWFNEAMFKEIQTLERDIQNFS